VSDFPMPGGPATTMCSMLAIHGAHLFLDEEPFVGDWSAAVSAATNRTSSE
jgi:hypothetical protein